MKIIKTNYKLKKDINKKIVLISDIHYYSKKNLKYLNKVLDNIKKIRPDYICIPGDLIDCSNVNDEIYLIKWLIKLSNISKVIISVGNHEFYVNKKKKMFKLNDELLNKINSIDNVYLLNNKNQIIDNINFIGLTLPIESYYDNIMGDFNLKTYKKYYNILLCHSPINICNEEIMKNMNVDLILCGHMHGGITPKFLRPVLKNRGFISPNMKLFPKICYGNFKMNNIDIIITSGITILSHINKFRFLNSLFSSEIVEIDL